MHDTNSNIPVVVHPPPARPRRNSQGGDSGLRGCCCVEIPLPNGSSGFSGLDVVEDVSRQKWLRLCSAVAKSLAA